MCPKIASGRGVIFTVNLTYSKKMYNPTKPYANVIFQRFPIKQIEPNKRFSVQILVLRQQRRTTWIQDKSVVNC